MSVRDAQELYEAAVCGEPFPRPIFPEPLNTTGEVWIIGAWPITVPPPVPHSIHTLRRIILEIRGRTGWSARRLAKIVGSSHTTIISAENGRPLVQGHSGDLRQRLLDAHALVERVYLLAGRDAHQTEVILSTAPANGRSAVDELAESGDAGRAYIAALDILRPRRTGLIVGDRPRRDGRTAALHE